VTSHSFFVSYYLYLVILNSIQAVLLKRCRISIILFSYSQTPLPSALCFPRIPQCLRPQGKILAGALERRKSMSGGQTFDINDLNAGRRKSRSFREEEEPQGKDNRQGNPAPAPPRKEPSPSSDSKPQEVRSGMLTNKEVKALKLGLDMVAHVLIHFFSLRAPTLSLIILLSNNTLPLQHLTTTSTSFLSFPLRQHH